LAVMLHDADRNKTDSWMTAKKLQVKPT